MIYYFGLGKCCTNAGKKCSKYGRREERRKEKRRGTFYDSLILITILR
jgi:hypothetical protein